MPNLIWKRLVTASYGHYGQSAARIGPDRICQIRLPASVSAPVFFFLFFQRRHGSYRADPTRYPIWMAWSGFGPNTSGLEARRCAGIIWPGFWQAHPACYQFPICRLGFVLPQASRIIIYCSKPARIRFSSG